MATSFHALALLCFFLVRFCEAERLPNDALVEGFQEVKGNIQSSLGRHAASIQEAADSASHLAGEVGDSINKYHKTLEGISNTMHEFKGESDAMHADFGNLLKLDAMQASSAADADLIKKAELAAGQLRNNPEKSAAEVAEKYAGALEAEVAEKNAGALEDQSSAGGSSFSQLHESIRAQPEEEKASLVAKGELREASDASSGMAQIREESVALRKGMAELGLDFDRDQAVLARAKLQELSLEKKRVKEMADNLDRQMHEQFAALLDTNAASLLSIADDTHDASQPSEDAQFAQLEEQTNNIVHWFSQLKHLREERDKVKTQHELAVKAASSIGLSREEVQQESTSAVASDHRGHLASVMASSAIEMAQIQSAAGDVMSGLDQLGEWKKRQDSSPESLAEASKVKAKLSDALQFLKEHEGIVEKRTNQINDLMMAADMGRL